jgi:hypothetical protein
LANTSTKRPKSELDYNVTLHKIDAVASVVKYLIKYGGLVACFYLIYRSTLALAGKVTLADFALRVFGNVTVNKAFCALFGSGGILYGVGQRQLRRRAVKRLGKNLSTLEGKIDSGRSSSGLTDTGETRPDDEEET